MRAMSLWVASPMRLRASGLKVLDGARLGALFDLGLATGPAWPIWPAMAAPCSWIASASRARPGTASSRNHRHSAWVRPPGATAR
jgi:hypothetical protein